MKLMTGSNAEDKSFSYRPSLQIEYDIYRAPSIHQYPTNFIVGYYQVDNH